MATEKIEADRPRDENRRNRILSLHYEIPVGEGKQVDTAVGAAREKLLEGGAFRNGDLCGHDSRPETCLVGFGPAGWELELHEHHFRLETCLVGLNSADWDAKFDEPQGSRDSAVFRQLSSDGVGLSSEVDIYGIHTGRMLKLEGGGGNATAVRDTVVHLYVQVIWQYGIATCLFVS